MVSHAFDVAFLRSNEIYRKLLTGKFDINLGMIMENVVAQMLVAAGHSLYFYSNTSSPDRDSRMEIDFMMAKEQLTNRHNVLPIEVKSGKKYTISSLRKFIEKYSEQLYSPYVIHDGDYYTKEGICYLPLYMTPALLERE